MLDELYKDNLLAADKQLSQCDITLGIDMSSLKKTQKVSKNMEEEEANKIRDSNELIRKEREADAEAIADKFSVFKRDLLSAPIRQAMNAVIKGTKPPAPCQIPYRKNEKYWVFPEEKDIGVTFEVQMDGVVDQSLARIYLLELKDSRRAVMSAPQIEFHDKELPENVVAAFPDGIKERTSNGSLSIKLGSTHLKKGIDLPLSQLIGFRQYLHFHLHAIKI